MRQAQVYFVGYCYNIYNFLIWLWFIGVRSPITKQESFQITDGSSVNSVAIQLKEQGWIDSVNCFKALVVVFGGNVQTGIYDIPAKQAFGVLPK